MKTNGKGPASVTMSSGLTKDYREKYNLMALMGIGLLLGLWLICIDLDFHESWGLDVVLFFNSFHNPISLNTMKAISFLGEDIFFMALPIFVWANSPSIRKFGFWFSLLVTEGFFLEGSLKLLFGRNRPNHPLLVVHDQDAAKGELYSFPSGHTFCATITWVFVAYMFRGRWVTLGGIGIIGLIGFSRVFLAAHYPHDVIGAVFFGLIFLAVWILAHPKQFSFTSGDIKQYKSVSMFHVLFLLMTIILNIYFYHETKDVKAAGFHLTPTLLGAQLLAAYFGGIDWDGGDKMKYFFYRFLMGLPVILFGFILNRYLYLHTEITSSSDFLIRHVTVFLVIFWMWISGKIFKKCGLANYNYKTK